MVVALVTALLASLVGALPAAAAPNVPRFTVSPASPTQTDAVTLTVTIDGCGGQQPWNVYYLVDSRPYRDGDRENARFNNGVLTNGGDTWTASVTLPAGTFEAGSYSSNAYGIGPCFANDRFVDSNIVYFTVPQIGTTVSGVAPATAVAGDTVQVDVAVAPSAATGSVTITENGRTLGGGTLSQGTARVAAGPLTAGSHDLVVTYGGDRNHSGSMSAPIHIEVARAQSPLTVVATPSSAIRFQDVRVDVTAPASADGTFEISDGGVVVSSGNALVDGVGSTVLNDLGTGPHELLVSYSGSTEHEPSTATVFVEIRRASTPLSVTATPADPVRFQSVRIDVAAPSTADGTFDVREDGIILSAANSMVDGAGSVVLNDLATGTHDLLVTYYGTADHEPSTASIVFDVTLAASPLTVTTTPSDAVRFEFVQVDVNAPSTADGTFEISEGGVVLSSGNALIDGAGSTVLDDLAAGRHELLVSYSGSADHQPSTALVHVDVARAQAPLTVTASPSSMLRGDGFDVFVEATVPASGTFTVSENGVVLSEGNTLREGSGLASLGDLTAGVHQLLVSYGGNADYEPSTGTTTVTVDLRPTTTSMYADRDGSQLTLVAEVLADADWHTWPKGSVQFTEGDVVLGTVELLGGVAELVVESAAVGPHQLQAHYLGDDTTGPSDSAVVTAVVPGMTVPATATAGEALRVQATGFAAYSDVAVILDGGRIGTLFADADGAVDSDVIVPATASGVLMLMLRGEDANGDLVLLEQEITVADAPAPPVVTPPVKTPPVTPPPAASPVVTLDGTRAGSRPTTTSAAPTSLARTGPTEPLALVLAGMLSLLVGATLVARTRPGRR